MVWREGDWAPPDEGAERVLYEAPPRPAHRARYTVAGILLAVVVCAALYGAGHFPRGHPLVPALDFRLPGLETHSRLETSTARFGSTFTIDGTTPHHENGTVRLDGSWNGGPTEELAVAETVDGAYVLRFPIREHGTLELRVRYPGGDASGTVVVP